MSRGVNRVILVGHLGKDPDVRYSPQGTAVANCAIATSESWKDKNTGEKQEKTEWHRLVFFGKLAEIVGEYCRKGGQIFVEGKLQTRKWTDKDGHDRWTTEIVCHEMQMLGSKSDGAREEQSPPRDERGAGKRETATAGAGFDDDIPFAPLEKRWVA